MEYEKFKKDFNINDASQDNFQATPKSSVKLTKNTKGIKWEVKVVQGEEGLLEGLMKSAIDIHKKLSLEFNIDERRLCSFCYSTNAME